MVKIDIIKPIETISSGDSKAGIPNKYNFGIRIQCH